ncbi:serpin family protein [Streptomyces sp. NPDC047123]|uniref:serpin family protein n=1 Tax=Streptomyces sp. NPDC047123 TaxID=3155622 RepID=UPI0033D17DAF
MRRQTSPSRTVVRAVNRLTSRWAGTASAGRGTVLSAAGVWPLPALLADGADGAARAELADAVGMPADETAGAARELLAAPDSMRGVDAALGLWTRRTLTLRDAWREGVPAGALGVLTGDPAADAAALDAWAAERTGGQIERMPEHPDEGTEFVLASALALRTDWFRPFGESVMTPGAGPWRGVPAPLDVPPRPLAVRRAARSATATFGALGFRAAAVTPVMGVAAGVPEKRYVTTEVGVAFDRPFGFLAVHRTSRLVLAAGRVTDPEPFREDEDAHVPE